MIKFQKNYIKRGRKLLKYKKQEKSLCGAKAFAKILNIFSLLRKKIGIIRNKWREKGNILRILKMKLLSWKQEEPIDHIILVLDSCILLLIRRNTQILVIITCCIFNIFEAAAGNIYGIYYLFYISLLKKTPSLLYDKICYYIEPPDESKTASDDYSLASDLS